MNKTQIKFMDILLMTIYINSYKQFLEIHSCLDFPCIAKAGLY